MRFLQRQCFVLAMVFAASSVTVVAEDPWSADPDLVSRLAAKRPEVIYEETRVPTYDLPDPLMFLNGKPVTTADQWPDRRQELLDLFRSNVYGYRPNIESDVRFETIQRRPLFDGKVVGTQVKAKVVLAQQSFTFHFAVYRRADSSTTKSLPAIIQVNNRSFVSPEKAEQSDLQFFPILELTKRNYVAVTFHTSDVDPDQKNSYADGIRSFLANGRPPKPKDWRALSAWGWAASRILDFLESDPTIDARRVAVVGHSRGGKAALWAAAEDDRFAAAYSNQSGCGGAALSRRRFGERVKRITENFPYWFNESFATYAERENELPVDQHELIALLAPRRVFVNSAAEDLWADPRGEYLSLVGAEPVFALLGQPGINDASIPSLNETRVAGVMGYRVRAGKHSLVLADWNEFLKFAGPTLQPAGVDSERK